VGDGLGKIDIPGLGNMLKKSTSSTL